MIETQKKQNSTMYATKPLSLFKSQPEAVSLPPPDGQNSGYLVVKSNDDGDDDETCCWGQYGGTRVHDLPFPQDRVLTLRYTEHNGRNNTTETDSVLFVSVPDQPIASNRYYAVVASGKRKGLIRTCSREEDMTPFCFSRCINDVSPQPFDPADVYQQIEIVQRRRGRFTAKAVAADGFPNYLFRKKYWRVYASMLKNHSDLGDAPGLNVALRSLQLADASLLEASPAATAMSAAVGKWYCPFYLIKEDGLSPSEQMDRATFYEVALEQRWEPVHDTHSGSKLYSRRVLMGGSLEARLEVSSGAPRHGDGYVWFRAAAGQSVGVCSSVWERMRWEEYSGGWVDEEEEAEKVAGRSVLVERFVVKRMDMTVVVAFEPVHDTHSGSKLYSRRVLMGGSLEARLEVSSGAPRHGDGYVWFRAAAGQSVGVCSSVWERMRWEEYSGGWVDEEEEAEKVAGRSVLVERFVVKRMDMTVVVAFDFVHLNKARGKQM